MNDRQFSIPALRRAIAVIALCAGALGAQMVIYPAKGQSQKQQQKDQGECQTWATKNTGVDPVALAQAPAPEPAGPAVGGGERAARAARGAIGGAIGAIAGDAGQGAAIGAVVGTMAGGRQARQNQSAHQQHVQAQQQQMNTWTHFGGSRGSLNDVLRGLHWECMVARAMPKDRAPNSTAVHGSSFPFERGCA